MLLGDVVPGDETDGPLPTFESSSNPPRLLVVDDDSSLREMLRVGLEGSGFGVAVAKNGEDAISVFERERTDIIVLDVMMPGMDGVDVCRRIRRISDVPIIMLTARTSENDVVLGLEAGADDYVSKPFSLRELVARVRSNLRRKDWDASASARSPGRQVFDGERFVLDAQKRWVELDNQVVPLSRTEFALMQHLVANEGRVVAHDEIMQHLWQATGPAEQSKLRTYMGMIRRKLGESGREGRYLHSHHGIGYRFEPPRENGQGQATGQPPTATQ